MRAHHLKLKDRLLNQRYIVGKFSNISGDFIWTVREQYSWLPVFNRQGPFTGGNARGQMKRRFNVL